MARGKWIDKKSAQHFTLVHRPQNDPLIHDENAPSMVLNPVAGKSGPAKSKHLDDLASELGSEAESIRENEGEAASYGVYYDDTEYDYMQHLRDLNAGSGDVVFVESTSKADKGKGKQKESLESALKQMGLEEKSGDLFDEEILPSKNLTRTTYEAQQEIPDSLKGFQPDMDPRLREVLEALEDDAFVDEDDEVFQELAKDGRELDDFEFEEAQYYDDDDEGWESDHTAKPNKEYKDDTIPDLVQALGEHPDEGPSQDWMADFNQFKKEQKTGKAPLAPAAHSELHSTWTTTTNGGKRKKRKGALTDASSYSMSSSSMVRTEQMTLLDARFDKIEERYNEELDDDLGSVSAVSTMSTIDGPLRSDFDGIMDEFLGNFTKPGKRTSKKKRPQTGLEQLDEIRKELGQPRIRARDYTAGSTAKLPPSYLAIAAASEPIRPCRHDWSIPDILEQDKPQQISLTRACVRVPLSNRPVYERRGGMAMARSGQGGVGQEWICNGLVGSLMYVAAHSQDGGEFGLARDCILKIQVLVNLCNSDTSISSNGRLPLPKQASPAAAAMTSPSLTTAAPPPPRDLSHHWSAVTKSRAASQIKGFYQFFQIPGISNLAGGMPNVKYFPYDTLEAQVAQPQRWKPTPNAPHKEDQQKQLLSSSSSSFSSKPVDPAAAAHITVPKTTSQADPLRKIDLSVALQYGTSRGFPPLHSFIRQFSRDVLHDVPYNGGAEIILTCGSTDGFSKTLELIVDPWGPDDPVADRPGMLCEVFVYGNVLTQARPKGVQVVPVEIDGQGMLADGPGGLEEVLENWDFSKGRRPHFIYSVTMGHNPTSGVLSVQRRKDIYKLCCKYDILIVEDDPYWYLQFPSAVTEEAKSRGLQTPEATEVQYRATSTGYDFIDSLVPSYLNVDTEGRVIRLDTFSKTIAPGCRLGWITTQPAFIERLERITEVTTQQPSGFVQSMVAELIMGPQPGPSDLFRNLSAREKLTFRGWNMDGWVRWLAGLRGEYERRMNRMCSILDAHAFELKQSTPVRDADADWGVITKTRLISFDWPRGGMFVWIRVHFESHPLWRAEGDVVPYLDGPVLATAFLMFCTHKPHLVLGAPGAMFSATPEILIERGWAYVRVCFAAESEENVDGGSLRFATALQKFWKVKKVEEMEKYVKEMPSTKVMEMEGLENLGGPIGC
ncbi:hypothetical protein G7046_g9261 [Stylonectria norvegica]|nr:hypothetical protein G7046_g9261 [Stylonectria norvegica]